MARIKDGLYQVKEDTICAGFIVLDGEIRICAPVLKERIEHWKTKAKLIRVFTKRKPR